MTTVQNYEHLLIRLHDMIGRRLGDDPAADAIRDEMELLESKLSEAEIARLNVLSAELASRYVE